MPAYVCFCYSSFTLVVVVLFSTSLSISSRNSDPGSQIRFLPPSPLRCVPSTSIARRVQHFLPSSRVELNLHTHAILNLISAFDKMSFFSPNYHLPWQSVSSRRPFRNIAVRRQTTGAILREGKKSGKYALLEYIYAYTWYVKIVGGVLFVSLCVLLYPKFRPVSPTTHSTKSWCRLLLRKRGRLIWRVPPAAVDETLN